MDTVVQCSCNHTADEDEQKIFHLVRMLAPDLDELSDNMIYTLIDLHKHYVSKVKFGVFYHEAVAYLVAHKATVHQMLAASGAESGAMVGGGITSEHEGDLSRSYGSAGSGNRGYNDTFDKTFYGLEFKRIRDMCIAPIATRFFG